jgi:hypothetical protein
MQPSNTQRFVVFDVETDRLLNAARDNWTDLRVTTCVAVESLFVDHCVAQPIVVHEIVLFDDIDKDARSAADHARFGLLMDSADAVVAYNGRGFDLRVLFNHYDAERVKRWTSRLVDPFEAIRKATNSWVKLDELLDANGLPRKAGAGVDAVEWWADGQRSRVMEYCRQDAIGLHHIICLDDIRFPIKRWTANGEHAVECMATLKWREYLSSCELFKKAPPI